MPALSPTMSQGNIAKWYVKVGDQVQPGSVLADIETDKATLAFENQEDGYVASILVPEGTKDIPIGRPVAVLVEEKADIAAFANFSAGGGKGGAAAAAAPTARKASAPVGPSVGKAYPPHQVFRMGRMRAVVPQCNYHACHKLISA